MIPGDLLSAFPHRQFHTLPGLLDSWAALPKSNPNALRAIQGGSLYHFYDGLFSAWNHFILYMDISLDGLFNGCENGWGSIHHLKNYGGFCIIPLNTFRYLTMWQMVLLFCI